MTTLPAFSRSCLKNWIINLGVEHEAIANSLSDLAAQAQMSSRVAMRGVLFSGARGCGKSSLAAHLAGQTKYSFVNAITPQDLIQMHETCEKIRYIIRVFNDARCRERSVVILDDIERLIGYSCVGGRTLFSNEILQALLVLCRHDPESGYRLLVIGTTALPEEVLESMGLLDAFDVRLKVPFVSSNSFDSVMTALGISFVNDLAKADAETEFRKAPPFPIKKLIAVLDMAASISRAEAGGSPPEGHTFPLTSTSVHRAFATCGMHHAAAF